MKIGKIVVNGGTVTIADKIGKVVYAEFKESGISETDFNSFSESIEKLKSEQRDLFNSLIDVLDKKFSAEEKENKLVSMLTTIGLGIPSGVLGNFATDFLKSHLGLK